MSEANGNAAEYFVARHLREGRGDRVAFTDPWRSLTYAELDAASARFAAGLQRAGIERERRIALVMLDTIDFPIAFWGALRAGVVPVPINTLLPADITGYILQDSRAAALFVSAPLLEALKPAARRARPGRRRQRRTARAAGSTDFLAGSPASASIAECSPDEVAFWLYSSGSTGMPKGVRHVHSSLQATADTYAASVLGLQPDDVVFSVAKLFFAYGLGNSMTFPMAVGASAVLLPDRPTPDAVLDVMRRHSPTMFCGVPTLYAALLAHPELGPGAGSDRLRLLHLGRRGAARASRACAGATAVGVRHPRRHRLDRDAAHLPVQPAGRHPLRHHRQGGAGLRAARGRRGRQRCRRRRNRRAGGARPAAPPTATGTSAASRG